MARPRRRACKGDYLSGAMLVGLGFSLFATDSLPANRSMHDASRLEASFRAERSGNAHRTPMPIQFLQS